MKKTISIVGIIIGFLGIIRTPSVFAANPPEMVTIKALQDKQAPVAFPHKAHEAKLNGKCTDCHTTAKGGPLKPEFTDVKGKGQMKNAYHAQCLECHKKVKGPTTCSACHKKK